MFEKVNKYHPDKIADRIAGAIVDLAYKKNDNPKCAVEVLIGHGECNIIIESSENFEYKEILPIVLRITKNMDIILNLRVYKQDIHLASNQDKEVRCGDNGIFKGVPLEREEDFLSNMVQYIEKRIPYDGKYIINGKTLIACQSNASKEEVIKLVKEHDWYGIEEIIVNPIGDWTGGINVDSGATNRKLGSDMAQSVTGGGLHGKDGKTKADVCCNVWAFSKAQEKNKVVELFCAIGDTEVKCKIDGIEQEPVPFSEISEFGHNYIMKHGGYEFFASWGLV